MERNNQSLVLEIDAQASTPYRLSLSPSLGFGTSVKTLKVNGEEKDFRVEDNRGDVRCVLDLEIKGKTIVEIETEGSIFLHSPPHFPQIGDKTSGLKIIRAQYQDNQLQIIVEGLADKDYTLSIITPRSIHSASEAELMKRGEFEKKIKINFESKEEGYIRKKVNIRFEENI